MEEDIENLILTVYELEIHSLFEIVDFLYRVCDGFIVTLNFCDAIGN